MECTNSKRLRNLKEGKSLNYHRPQAKIHSRVKVKSSKNNQGRKIASSRPAQRVRYKKVKPSSPNGLLRVAGLADPKTEGSDPKNL